MHIVLFYGNLVSVGSGSACKGFSYVCYYKFGISLKCEYVIVLLLNIKIRNLKTMGGYFFSFHFHDEKTSHDAFINGWPPIVKLYTIFFLMRLCFLLFRSSLHRPPPSPNRLLSSPPTRTNRHPLSPFPFSGKKSNPSLNMTNSYTIVC